MIRKLICLPLVVTLLFSVSSVYAQNDDFLNFLIERRVERITDQIELSEDQVLDLTDLMIILHEEYQCHDSDNWEDRETCFESLQSEIFAALEALLTEDQIEAYEEYVAEHDERIANRELMKAAKRAKKLVRLMVRELELTDDQKDAVKDVIEAVKEEYSCKELETRSERSTCKKDAARQVLSDVESLLTEEQYAAYEELKDGVEDGESFRPDHGKGGRGGPGGPGGRGGKMR